MIAHIDDIDELPVAKLEELQEVLDLISPDKKWGTNSLYKAVEMQTRLNMARRKARVTEGITEYIELIREENKGAASMTDDDVIYLALRESFMNSIVLSEFALPRNNK